MRVELIDDDLAGERWDSPAEPLVIEDEGQLIALRDEFDTARRKLLGECSRHGTRGFRIEDDFDITESQVFSVGGFFFRHLDICVITKKFLRSPFLASVKKFLDEVPAGYCVSVHSDIRMGLAPPVWMFLRREVVELSCRRWWERRRLIRVLEKL
jgi:hypothetical protein